MPQGTPLFLFAIDPFASLALLVVPKRRAQMQPRRPDGFISSRQMVRNALTIGMAGGKRRRVADNWAEATGLGFTGFGGAQIPAQPPARRNRHSQQSDGSGGEAWHLHFRGLVSCGWRARRRNRDALNCRREPLARAPVGLLPQHEEQRGEQSRDRHDDRASEIQALRIMEHVIGDEGDAGRAESEPDKV